MQRVPFTTPYDYTLSPESGWTRQHWVQMFEALIVPVIDNASPGKARQLIPGPRSHHGRVADELEGFTRTFIMAGPYLAGSESPYVGSGEHKRDVAAFYREGILNGTDSNHPEYWGDIYDYAQHLVEIASLAWSLYLSRNHIWDKFDDAEKQQVAGYLNSCNAVKYHQNNWLLFNVVTNAVLKKLGMPYSQEKIDANIEACEHMYVGSGWYRDGNINRIDYYNAWAFHYYYLIWTILDGESKPELADRHRQRVAELTVQMPYFVSGDGSAPIFGRSMIYRFAYLAPIVLGHYLGALDLPVGLLRTTCNKTMRFFADQEIITDEGFLGLGFVAPNESILEHYSCGGSPYWAAKAFNALMIPEDDPFWNAEEEPAPIDRGDYSVPLNDAGLTLIGSYDDGQVQLINQKSYHDKDEYNAKYTNFAYSTLFPYESRRVYGSVAPDNALQFSNDGILFHQRWEMEHLEISGHHSSARYPLHIVDPEGSATSTVLTYGGVLVLIHAIDPTQPLWFREGGFPLGYDGGTPEITRGSDWTAASIDGRSSLIAGVYGYDRVIDPQPYGLETHGTNVRFRSSVIPQLTVTRREVSPFVLVSLVAGRGAGVRPEQLRGLVSAVAVSDARGVTVTYADGTSASVDGPAGSVAWR